MDTQTVKQIMKDELPKLVRSDKLIRKYVLDLYREGSLEKADKKETESRFDRILEELKQDRKEQSRKWEENQEEIRKLREDPSVHRHGKDLKPVLCFELGQHGNLPSRKRTGFVIDKDQARFIPNLPDRLFDLLLCLLSGDVQKELRVFHQHPLPDLGKGVGGIEHGLVVPHVGEHVRLVRLFHGIAQ